MSTNPIIRIQGNKLDITINAYRLVNGETVPQLFSVNDYVVVELIGKELYTYTPTYADNTNVLHITDNGELPMGDYAIAVRVVKNGERMRTKQRDVLRLIDAIDDAVIGDGDGSIEVDGITISAVLVASSGNDIHYYPSVAAMEADTTPNANAIAVIMLNNGIVDIYIKKDGAWLQATAEMRRLIQSNANSIEGIIDRLDEVVIDGNEDTMEHQMQHIADVVAGNADDINSLQSELNTASDDISVLQGSMNTAEDDILFLQSIKADKSTTYTKTETDTLLAGKAAKNGSTSEDFAAKDLELTSWELKSGSGGALVFDSKASGDVTLPVPNWSKTLATTDQIPDVSGKADAATVNAALAGKADKSDTYTKEQTDALIPDISGKADASDVTALAGRVTIAEGQIARKQDALVSGENIKTVNGQSLLGSGNITIEGGGDPYVALRAMYIAADPRPASDPERLRYNAETGYYEMNRLTDITEEQMAAIFAHGHILSTYSSGHLRIGDARTLYPISGNAYYVINSNYFQYAPSIESVRLCANTITCAAVSTVINNCFQNSVGNLRYILDVILCHSGKFGTGAFGECDALEYVRLKGLKGDIYFKRCSKLNYESLRYLVANAANTVPITVTVHATTYGYLTGTIEPTAQVGGTSAEWQQIVADATAKNISFATA